jgi:hypothetical protein
MYKFFLILFTLLFAHSAAFACSMAQASEFPFSKVNPNSYIFVGEVIGYTENIVGNNEGGFSGDAKFYGEGKGLKVKPLEIINIPNDVPKDYFEVFSFGVTSWCAPRLYDSNFPIGTKLRIILTQTTLLPDRNSENKIRLEKKIFDRLSLVKSDDEFVTTEDSVFDYETFRKPLLDSFAANKDYEKIRSFDDFVYIESIKDLSRLKKATSEQEKYGILERLLYNPKIDFPALISPSLSGNYYRLLNSNIDKTKDVKLTKAEKNLLRKRKELEESGYFKF